MIKPKYESYFKRYVVIWTFITIVSIAIVTSGTKSIILRILALPINIVLYYLMVRTYEYNRALRCLRREYPDVNCKKYLEYFGGFYKRDIIEMHSVIMENSETAKIVDNHNKVILIQTWSLLYLLIYSAFFWMNV